MGDDEQAQISRVLDYLHGIILVTGPTGSGKSTSLNAFLRKINSTDLRIVTIEDPIEYEARRCPDAGAILKSGFPSPARSATCSAVILDVIMVGEIRDRETADIAIRASLTGHLVFSTLHTNDALRRHHPPRGHGDRAPLSPPPSSSSSPSASCAASAPSARNRSRSTKSNSATTLPSSSALIPLRPTRSRRSHPLSLRDCCRGTGYCGRIGSFESSSPTTKWIFIPQARKHAFLVQCARRHGMRTLQQSGWEKIKAGHTTFEEVLRVITVTEK